MTRTPHTNLTLVKTEDYTVQVNDVVVLATGNVTITLPADHERQGHQVVIKNIGTGHVIVFKEEQG